MDSFPFHSTMDEAPSSGPSSPRTSAHVDDETIDHDHDHEEFTAIDSNSSNPAIHNPPLCFKRNRKKKKKRVVFNNVPELPSSSSSCSSPVRLFQKGVNCKRRNPKILIAHPRRLGDDFDSVALSLGMSFAAFVAQVLEKQVTSGERMSVDHLSVICTSAVRESLVSVFGDKLDCFLRNFEKSFGSTLKTLRSISESSTKNGVYFSSKHVETNFAMDLTLDDNRNLSSGSSLEECCSETFLRTDAPINQLRSIEEVKESITGSLNRELALHGQSNDLTSAASRMSGSQSNEIALSTYEKSVVEQVRSNDLKIFELGLAMKKLKLKETQIALNYDLNNLERSKLAMGISKASFKAEKFKSQLEDTRHTELLRKCIDCLVAGLLIMSVALSYGVYVYSYHRISEATTICTPSIKESNSWWIPNPMASFNSGLHKLRCQVQVVSRMVYGVIMIFAIAYLLFQRSATSKQSMPVTFIVLLLGVACGLAGKFCVDTLGGSGYHWLFFWETLCLLHLFANMCTSALFLILHGPVGVSQGKNDHTIFPYWIRRTLFYSIVLVLLPLLCGLVPFAGLGEWKDHFFLLVMDLFTVDY